MSVITQPTDLLRLQDPQMADVLAGERDRQATTLQLSAAENFTSTAVLAALGSALANKYAEGYPGARHHGGCEYADMAERMAVERAKVLFGAEHANVQPHSGSSAVLAAYAALLRPGDTVLAMGLPYGGTSPTGRPPTSPGAGSTSSGTGSTPRRASSTISRCRTSPARTGRRPSCAGPSPTRATPSTRPSGRSPTRSGPT